MSWYSYTYNAQDLREREDCIGPAIPELPTLPDGVTTYQYNPVNQLLSTTNPDQAFTYDADGNLTKGYTPEGFVFTAVYDAENRMIALTFTDETSILHTTTYAYDGDGLLAIERKYENAVFVQETRFVRHGGLVLQDRDGNNAVVNEYTWGLNLGGGIGGLLNFNSGGQNYAYLYDGSGNVGAVLDAAQAVVAAYRYDPFGSLLVKTGSVDQSYGFSTKRYNEQLGMLFYEFRPYIPGIGRWATRDPLGEAGGLNLYAFVGNNPVNWIDPWGLETVLIFPTEATPPWNPDYAVTMSTLTYGSTYDSLDIEVINVNRVSQINAALQKYEDIIKVFFIGHSSSQALYAGEASLPDTNLSPLGGPNDVHPNSLDWSHLTENASIAIWGCNAGRGGALSIAQSIANASGKLVTAPTEYINFTETGRPFIRWEKGRFGKWEQFTPQKRK